MKKLLLIISCILWLSNTFSQEMTIVDGQLVERKVIPENQNIYFKSIFLNISLNNALEKAANENKYILIYFTSKGCGYCRKMEQTILTDTLRNTINENYISLKNNIDSCGYDLNTEFKIRAYPSFIILDNKKTIVKKRIGCMTVKELSSFINIIKD